MAEQSDTLGSVGISPGHYIRPPHVPTIVSEWAGLSPLVFHLASSQDDYTTTGDISLLGRFPVTLFPPLGTFAGMARLLEKGTQYIDYASTKGGSSQTTWDVKYGGFFPVANGAASASIISYLVKKHHPKLEKCYTIAKAPRSQILNIYEFSKGDKRSRSWNLRHNKYWQTLSIVFLIGLCAFFAIFGAFGTAAIALTCAVSRVFALIVTFERPTGYLISTENQSACMLVAAHQNALEWHLFTGDRAVVDTLLNKPTIEVPKWNGRTHAASTWFRVADFAQLIAMTFTAADKGWDGICLVFLLTAHYALSWWLGRDALAKDWLDQNNITVNTRCLEFSGRFPLIGTIQMLSGAENSSWMDSILDPTTRRDLWLRALKVQREEPILFDKEVSQDDRDKVNSYREWTQEAIAITLTLQCQGTPTINAAKM